MFAEPRNLRMYCSAEADMGYEMQTSMICMHDISMTREIFCMLVTKHLSERQK